jgi:hypothetical protein
MDVQLEHARETIPKEVEKMLTHEDRNLLSTGKHSCFCGKPKCKELMRKYAALSGHYGKWVQFPRFMPLRDFSNKITVQFRNTRRIKFASSLGAPCPPDFDGSHWFVAIHHFHPIVIHYYHQFFSSKTNFPVSVPIFIGKSIYNDTMLNEAKDEYMTLPCYTLESAEDDYKLQAVARGAIPADVNCRLDRDTKSLSNALGTKRSSPDTQAAALIIAADKVDMTNDIKIGFCSDKVDEIIDQCSQGLGGMNLMNISWHKRYTTAAKHYFGFDSFAETVYYCHALFGTPHAPVSDPDNFDVKLKSVLAKILAVKMLIHRDLSNEEIGHIWGVLPTTVTYWIAKFAPLWAEVGDDLSILDVSPDFLIKDTDSGKYTGDLKNVSALVDGKIIMTDTFRKETLFTQAQFSNKVHHPGVLFLSWTTTGGLVFESTPPVLGRSSEKSNVKYWGSYRGCVPMRVDGETVNGLGLDEAFCFQLLKEGDNTDQMDVAEPSDTGDEEECDEPEDISQNMRVLMQQLEDSQLNTNGENTESDEDESDDGDETDDDEADGMDCKEMIDWYAARDRHSGAEKVNVKHTKETIQKYCDDAIQGGPDMNASRKIKQLKRHDRLDVLYRTGKIALCHFSFYLAETRMLRAKLLSELLGEVNSVSQLPMRLLKVPAGTTVLADRGFAEDAILYPNLNSHITPAFLKGQTQFELDQVMSDKCIKELRYTSEVLYARVTCTKLLKDSVSFNRLHMLDPALRWGLGSANLCSPLRPSQEYWNFVRSHEVEVI